MKTIDKAPITVFPVKAVTKFNSRHKPTTTDTHMADGVSGSAGRALIGSGGGGICWDKLAGLSCVPRRRTLAAATGRVVDDCDGEALLHNLHNVAVMLTNLVCYYRYLLYEFSDMVKCISLSALSLSLAYFPTIYHSKLVILMITTTTAWTLSALKFPMRTRLSLLFSNLSNTCGALKTLCQFQCVMVEEVICYTHTKISMYRKEIRN